MGTIGYPVHEYMLWTYICSTWQKFLWKHYYKQCHNKSSNKNKYSISCIPTGTHMIFLPVEKVFQNTTLVVNRVPIEITHTIFSLSEHQTFNREVITVRLYIICPLWYLIQFTYTYSKVQYYCPVICHLYIRVSYPVYRHLQPGIKF